MPGLASRYNQPFDDSSSNQNERQYGSLTRSDIQEFRRLVKETTGADLTEAEAWTRAHELLALYRMFLSPLPEDPSAEPSAPSVPMHEAQEPAVIPKPPTPKGQVRLPL